MKRQVKNKDGNWRSKCFEGEDRLMGWWELKPSEQLDPYKCLRIDLDDVLDFVTVDVKEGYTLSEVDKEHIYNQIRKEWNVAGEINDWNER